MAFKRTNDLLWYNRQEIAKQSLRNMFVCVSLCAFEDKMELKHVSVYTYGSLFHSILSSMEVCIRMCVHTLLHFIFKGSYVYHIQGCLLPHVTLEY